MVTFGMLTPTVAVILLVIALILFGPGKIPQLAKGLGRGIKDFKAEVNGDTDETVASTEKKNEG